VKFRRLKFSQALQVRINKLQAQVLKTGHDGAQRWQTLEMHKVVAFQGGEVHTRKIILFDYLLHYLDGLELKLILIIKLLTPEACGQN